MSFGETIDRIHDLGGLATIAHPTAFFKGISEEMLDPRFDAIEVMNSRAVPFSYSVRKNRRMATALGLAQTGGSDAHSYKSVGDAYTIVDADSRSVADILEAIKKGRTQPEGEASNLIENIKTTTQIFLRKLIFKGFQ